MSEMFSAFGVATSGMGAYKTWLNAVADNIANMDNVTATSQPAFQERSIQVQAKIGAFDEALTSFETALAQASGRASRILVVAELLDFFVGSLWDDAGAIDLAHRVRHEPEVLAHPSVRAPLAVTSPE